MGEGKAEQCVLVVEDSAEIRDIWRRVFRDAGFQVVESENGAEGVRAAHRVHPDVIVMDLSLPVLDGIGAIQRLKADDETANVPVVVVSGDVFAADRAREIGCDAFLAKPVPVDQLIRTVDRVLAARPVAPSRYHPSP